MLGVEAAEERVDPVDDEAGVGSLALECLSLHHLYVAVARFEQAAEATLDGVEAAEPVKGHDDAPRCDTSELPEHSEPVLRDMEVVEKAHREDIAEGRGLEGEAATQVGCGAADVMGAAPIFQGTFDHGVCEVGRNEAGTFSQDEVREAAVAAGRIEDERAFRAGPGVRIQGAEAGKGAAEKKPLAAVHELLVETSVSAPLVIGDAGAVK